MRRRGRHERRRAIALAILLFALVQLSFHQRSIAMMSAATLQRPSDALARKCSAAVDHLSSLGINFLAIDFDQTMIDVHTGGRWKESVHDLAERLRPIFLSLVPEAARRNMRVAIVTFSPQTKHIREVLEVAFPAIADTIPIRGNDRTWTYEGNGMRMGKQEHMASAAEELMAKPALGVTDVRKETTVLIDDDPRNIKKSLKDGTRAVWFNPRDPEGMLDDILMFK